MERPQRHLYILSVLFLLVLFLGAIAIWVLPDRTFSPEENRNLQQRPSPTVETILDGVFSTDFETYLSDQFPLRDFFIGVKALSERAQLKQDNNGVYFGKDGYLFEVLEAPDQSILDKNLSGFQLLPQAAGKPLSLLLIPSSAQSLPQLLPPFAPQYDQQETLSFFEEGLSGENVDVISFFEAMANAQEQVYFKTDHHWNVRGAYLGYTALCESLGVDALPLSEFNLEEASRLFYGTLYSSAGDKTISPDVLELNSWNKNPSIEMTVVDDGTVRDSLFWTERLEEKDKYTVFNGGNHALVTTYNPDGNGKSLLLLKDSYAHALLPYLAATYTSVHMMDLRYYTVGVYEYIAENEIDQLAAVYSIKNIGEIPLSPLQFVPEE